MALFVAPPANHDIHVSSAFTVENGRLRLDVSATRSGRLGYSGFLYATMTRLGTPIVDAAKFRTEVALRHDCGMTLYRVKVRGQSGTDL